MAREDDDTGHRPGVASTGHLPSAKEGHALVVARGHGRARARHHRSPPHSPRPKMCRLVRQRGPSGQRKFEVTFFAPAGRAYVFTFGR
jgi:hypothetical protein